MEKIMIIDKLENIKNIKDKYIIEFTDDFNEKINKGDIPEGIRGIIFGDNFNQEIDKESLPESLEYLYFNNIYNKEIYEGVLPENLKFLRLGRDNTQNINKKILPKNLKFFVYTDNEISSFPENLKILKCEGVFTPETESRLPLTLKKLVVGMLDINFNFDFIPEGVEEIEILIDTFDTVFKRDKDEIKAYDIFETKLFNNIPKKCEITTYDFLNYFFMENETNIYYNITQNI